MVLVLAYMLRISEMTRDPAPQTNVILTVSLWVQFDPVSPKFKGHLQGAAN